MSEPNNNHDYHGFDGNTAASHIAYFFSDNAIIYPITPSTPMAEKIDQWSAEKRKNYANQCVSVQQMGSEAQAAGAVHGSLVAGGLTSTFTASQGLLLMIPNMYKMAGELLPVVFHVAARSVATHALSIFGDHSDIAAARTTGFSFLASTGVQEAMDLAIVAHLSTLKSSIPFVHFFDGFRTSHEVNVIDVIPYEKLETLLPLVSEEIKAFRDRALNPEHPKMIGTAQTADVFFQQAESVNKYYEAVPEHTQWAMDRVKEITGREYHLFDYFGPKNPKVVLIAMGSGAQVIKETIENVDNVGLIIVRLYRPFSIDHFVDLLPESVELITVLDRCKETAAVGEPLFEDVSSALLSKGKHIKVIGGRYGLSSRDFAPIHVMGVINHSFDYLAGTSVVKGTKFTVGIIDDVTHLSVPIPSEPINTVPEGTKQFVFWGLGGDGTVGSNKNAVKILGDEGMFSQGMYVYDSLKAGSLTVSHIRCGHKQIFSPYEIGDADIVFCSQDSYVRRFALLDSIKKRGIFVLNAPWTTADDFNLHVPAEMRKMMVEKDLTVYTIDASGIADKIGLGGRTNMILQAAFFKISQVIPDIDEAVSLLKKAVVTSYGKKGQHIVDMNFEAIDHGLTSYVQVPLDPTWLNLKDHVESTSFTPYEKTTFISDIFDPYFKRRGDSIPVSKFTPGGAIELNTSAHLKRGIALKVPSWDSSLCIQCNTCGFVCPHSVIRPFLLTDEEVSDAPVPLDVIKAKGPKVKGFNFKIQISPLDCTGCGSCANSCPKKGCLTMVPLADVVDKEAEAWKYVRSLPNKSEQLEINRKNYKNLQYHPHHLEFNGACAGCGEVPYNKLVAQLYGDNLIIANATGCSTIWASSYPLNVYCTNEKGEGPAWGNSLFEDNAEYGLGMVFAAKQRRQRLYDRAKEALELDIPAELKTSLKEWLEAYDDREDAKITGKKLIRQLFEHEELVKSTPVLLDILNERDWLRKPVFFCFMGDGAAYDIGYGGLDHVLASGEDINIMIMDTEVYSNTGGQKSKATHLAAQHKFAADGKKLPKKELGLMAMMYDNIYVASCAMGASPKQFMDCLQEGVDYKGPSLLMCYSPCIEHQIKGGMVHSQDIQKLAVDSGYWINWHYNPLLAEKGKSPMVIDSKEPSVDPAEFLTHNGRFQNLKRTYPDQYDTLTAELFKFLEKRWKKYQAMVIAYSHYNDVVPKEKKEKEEKPKKEKEESKKEEEKPKKVEMPRKEKEEKPKKEKKAKDEEKGNAAKFSYLPVYYGSETGTSEQFAIDLAKLLVDSGINSEAISYGETTISKIKMNPGAVFIMSSTGVGDMPGDAEDLYEELSNAKEDTLSGLEFGLFGLGAKSYDDSYQTAPKNFERELLRLNAKPFIDRGEGDEECDGGHEKTLMPWIQQLFQVVSSSTKPSASTDSKQFVSMKQETFPTIEAMTKVFPVVSGASQIDMIEEDIVAVGAVDACVRDFHGYETRYGTSYNSYLIMDESPVLIDTVKYTHANVLIKNIQKILPLTELKYVIINHAEIDHCSGIVEIMKLAPQAVIITNKKCQETMEKLYPESASYTYDIIKNKETRCFGKHTLQFILTPLLHWPESMMSFDITTNTLFSMDGFGQHRACGVRVDDQPGAPDLATHLNDQKAYWANILMLYGKQGQKLFKSLEGLEIKTIANAHGLVLRNYIPPVLEKIKSWATHQHRPQVFIMFDSMWKGTQRMAEAIKDGALTKAFEGVEVIICCAGQTHITDIVTDSLESAVMAIGSPRLNGSVLASIGSAVTYLGGLQPDWKRDGVAFGTAGWEVRQHQKTMDKIVEDAGLVLAESAFIAHWNPNEDDLKQCFELGQRLAELAIKKVQKQ
eukprot:TRINITY_DN2429_c0_g1_i1.p1 TRINITY_DN2429_c0_g1~~TRINITY_DN2429_c0_g1_i1.p1  ORF type:complete len:1864 (+),score=567.63 TRINITY_DN2429_c0_g1_i1:49-5592(+)